MMVVSVADVFLRPVGEGDVVVTLTTPLQPEESLPFFERMEREYSVLASRLPMV